ncbi:MAG: ribonuclease III [Leptolyngbyaceae cyanobacterium SM1_3_5]|nr:ribonuclease III [Leptolyngbyaceae cyanobacterium SM1_3_5]
MQDFRRQKQLGQFVQKLGLSDTARINWSLLDRALTHATFSSEANYEELEFVGDAVVKLTAAEFLLKTYPDAKAGELSAIRAILVSDRILARIADSYGLDRYLQMANSAIADPTGQETRSAAAFEAVLAALFMSTQNLSLIHPWLDGQFAPIAEVVRNDPARQNYKGALQEWAGAHFKAAPEYRLEEVNQIHNDAERFRAEVWLQGRSLGSGSGASKKAAEQAAAQAAYLKLLAEAG